MHKFTIGDRVIECKGTPSQRVGTVRAYTPCRNFSPPKDFPIVDWDSGTFSFSSDELLTLTHEEEQLGLFLVTDEAGGES